MKAQVKSAAAGAIIIFATGIAGAQVSTTNFFNWETAPVHPVDISPDATTLAVCNLPDNRVELFNITSGMPVAIGAVPVGLDPVSARFRSSSELWVANYISDSINIVDVPTLRVVASITCSNEPSDIVFAGTPQRAYVSCGQPNLVQVFDSLSLQIVTNLVIDGNRPRGLATSPGGSKVYVAIFESGNASTIIGTGISEGFPQPSAVNFPNAPSAGHNPPPNSGTNFNPAINPALGTNAPPRVSLIVKKNTTGRWMDDNQGDWTEYIRGTNAAFTGRIPGWDVPDHDLAVIDTSSLAITYATGLMNICMAVAVNPASGKITVVGTDALNQIRFEPVLQSIFIKVELAQVAPATLAPTVTDLNPHLTYLVRQLTQEQREKSIGDPRGIVWSADGSRGYVTGMGSDNLVIIDANGARAGLSPTIKLDTGPAGLALDDVRSRLYIYNRFAGSLSTVDTTNEIVLNTLPLFDPTPLVIKTGRPHLYNTHDTSGLGQAACASCHVDARFDRLAWDLGDPTGGMKIIGTNANFANFVPAATNHYHPMKGPMTTLTLQDIIGHEPFHWRGDRDGIEQFDVTFTNLQGAITGITSSEMQELKDFLSTVRFPPNPYRLFDNSLSTSIPTGQLALGRGVLAAGSPLPDGNAQAGQNDFRLSTAQGCIVCHTLPAGLGTDLKFANGHWNQVPLGTNSAHHIALIELERSENLPFKVPSLRNLFDKSGMTFTRTNSRSGFGFSQDGSVDNVVRFFQDGFGITNDQTSADIAAFLLSLTGSDLLSGSQIDINRSPGVSSLDTAAAVGRQLTLNNSNSVPLLNSMLALANSSTSRVDLVAKGFKDGLPRGWFFDRTSGSFQSDRAAEIYSTGALLALAAPGSELTFTVVPRGTGQRIGIDRDADGYFDRDELDFGSDPSNALSLATNTPPQLGPVTNVTVLKGRLLTLHFSATDNDVPAQQLTFSLGTDAPPGSVINATNGFFSWTPAGPAGPMTNAITLTVTDSGTPNKSDSRTFVVIATDLQGGPVNVDLTGANVTWAAVPGVTYRVQYTTNLVAPVWVDLSGDVLATNAVGLKLDTAATNDSVRFYRIVALP